MKQKKILGLDLGTSSIGWALINIKENEEVNLIDGGVRIFQEPRDPKTKETLNTVRRSKRGARKLIRRRNERIETLKKHLIQADFFPKNSSEQMKYYRINPYELRAKALHEKLEKYELGRVLLHLGQRRGFLSNRKSPLKSEEQGILKEMSELEKAIKNSEYTTLGEYLYHLQGKESLRGRYTRRNMYFEEFQKIIEKQKEYYSELTDTFTNQIQRDIFFQNPLKSQKDLIGNCSYFPNRQRTHIFSLWAQEFRIWGDINNLRYRDEHGYLHALSPNQRLLVAEKLKKVKTLSYIALNKLLNFPKETQFNLERTKKQLQGNISYVQILNIVGEPWNTLSRERQDELVRYLIDIQSVGTLEKTLEKRFGDILDSLNISELVKLDFSKSKYMNLSEKAIKQILPILKEKAQSKTDNAGNVDDFSPYTTREAIKLLGWTPLEKYDFSKDKDTQMDFRNPSVTKAMYEMKKISKALKKKYKHIDEIHIELGSEIKTSEEKRKQIEKNQKENAKRNEEARKIIQEIFKDQGINNEVSREDILKYKLFRECEEKGGSQCPYTGKTINMEKLFGSGEIDIEHIIPWSRSLDDSYFNKTLCYADFNRHIKCDKTPYEVFSGNPEEYNRVKQRIKNYHPRKRERFEQQEINTDKFLAQQLVDTQYISQEVRDFLFAFFEQKTKILITKGKLTATLRYSWAWNRFLWDEGHSDDIKKTKNRGDHRHHFIDAVVVALTSQGILQKASILSQKNKLDKKEEIFGNIKPNNDFEKQFQEKLDDIIISFAPKHKINGAFHKETGYGILSPETAKKLGLPENKKGRGYFIKRVPLDENFKVTDLIRIYDATIRKQVTDVLYSEEVQHDSKLAFPKTGEWKVFHIDRKTPIKSVRIYEEKSISSMYDYQDEGNLFYETGSNHHVEILEHRIEKNKDGTPKKVGVFVTMLEAARRATQKEDVIQRVGPWKDGEKIYYEDQWNFKCSLMINDMVEIDEKYYVVTTLSGANNIIRLFKHIDADKKKDDGARKLYDIQTSPQAYEGNKIQISPIGIKYSAND